MADPLARIKALMGGEAAFKAAEAEAQAQSASSSQATAPSNSSDTDNYRYYDTTEHSRLNSQDILKSLLLSDSNIGKVAPVDMIFYPFWTVKNIADDMASASNQGRHPASLKTRGSFWSSEWSLYYLSSQFVAYPLLLIPSNEATSFLQHMKAGNPNELQEETQKACSDFNIQFSFPNSNLPRPRYLGKIRSKTSFGILQKALVEGTGPFNSIDSNKEGNLNTDGTNSSDEKAGLELNAFREMIEKLSIANVEHYPGASDQKCNPIANATGNMEGNVQSAPVNIDWKARKSASRNAALTVDKERCCSALRRTQRYLGLRASNHLQVGTSTMLNTEEPVLDCSSPPSYPLDLDAVFLSLDIEADEQNQDFVTEIGVAMLDTRDIKNLNPGQNGQNWLGKVTGRHFRVAERVHICNNLFVQGNPDKFDKKFGESELIPLSQTASIVRECFELHDLNTEPNTVSQGIKLRNIILVGHSVKNDIKWLQKIGLDILSIENLVEVLTTEELQKALKHEKQGGTALARLLEEMEIEAWNLHNAGNDAAYTLQALIAMAVQALSITRPVLGLEERIRKAQIKAKEEAEAEWEAWNAAEKRSKDGNAPVPYKRSHLRV